MSVPKVATESCPSSIGPVPPSINAIKKWLGAQNNELDSELNCGQFNHLDRLSVIARVESHKPKYRAYLKARIGDVEFSLMADSGNTYASCMNKTLFDALNLKYSELAPVSGKPLIGTAKKGATMEVKGETEPLELWLSPLAPPIHVRFTVIPDLEMPCNLSGVDLASHGIDLKIGSHLCYKGINIPLICRSEFRDDINRCGAKLYTQVAVTVGPLERVHVPAVTTDSFVIGKDVSISSIEDFEARYDLHPWRNVILSIQPSEQGVGVTKVGMMNSTGRPVLVPAGTYYGSVDPVTTVDNASHSPFSVCLLTTSQSSDRCSKATGTEVENYTLPPPPDCQNDLMLGDKIELPGWMTGNTNSSNWKQRFQYIRQLYKIDQNKNMPKPEQQSKFILLLLKYWQVFSWDGRYGSTHLIQHYIRTPPNCPPVNEPYRSPNPLLLNSLKEQLETWLQHDVIEPSDSCWNSNMLAVAKKDGRGSVRWVTDFRKLNLLTEIDRFPIGDISANLSKLSGSKYFSALDNSGAFHIIPIAPEDRHKTSFATPFNCFMYKKLPFGLSGGPSSYARLITRVLRGIPESVAVSFVDDVLCHSSTFDQHIRDLERVLKAYQSGGLKLNPKKCVFISNKIDYLGFTVSEKGIGPQEAYLEVVKNWPLPKTRQDVLVFLSKCSYYRKFVKDYAKIAEPLTKFLRLTDDCSSGSHKQTRPNGQAKAGPMTKTERRKRMAETVTHTDESRRAFNTLKNKLLTAPILGHPRFVEDNSEPFILDTDWCQETGTISGCLSQLQKQPNGTKREVALGYAAKKLSKSQLNYSSVKGEVCAVLYFMRYYAWFLINQKFLVRTDNIGARALKNGLREFIAPPGMAERWQLRLEAFDFDIIHRAGSKHGNADALSRCGHVKDNEPEMEVDVFDEGRDKQYLFSIESIEGHENWNATYISQVQDEDPEIGLIKKWVRDGIQPDSFERSQASKGLKSLINILESLKIDHNNVLRYSYTSKPPDSANAITRQLVILPKAQLIEAVQLIHKSIGHLGLINTIQASLKRVYGTDLRAVSETVCNTCLTCQAKVGPEKPQRHTLQPPRQGYPGMAINADIVGPLQITKSGYQYLLTVEDMFSRWLEAYPLRRCTGLAVANKLATEYFPRFGFPSILKFDRGTSFKNKIIQDLAESIGAQVIYSPSYSPKSNPVERQHRTLKSILKSMILDQCSDKPHRWEEFLPAALFCLRTMKNKTTGYSPFELTFGREAHTELDIIFGLPPQREEYPDYESFQLAYRHNMERAFKWANDNISTAIKRARRYHYNQPQFVFDLGQKVWLLTPIITPGQRKSFRSPWSGPWVICRRINEVVYEISPHRSWSHRSNQVVTVDRLKKYISPPGEADDDDDIDNTHAPGINDDLTFPGDEFLEEIPTKASHYISDDEYEIDNDDDEERIPAQPVLQHHQQPQQPPDPQPPPSPPPPEVQPLPPEAAPHHEPAVEEPVEQPPPQPLQLGARSKKRQTPRPPQEPTRYLGQRSAASKSQYYRSNQRERQTGDDDEVGAIPDVDDLLSLPDTIPDDILQQPTDEVLSDDSQSVDLSNQDIVFERRRTYAENPEVPYHYLSQHSPKSFPIVPPKTQHSPKPFAVVTPKTQHSPKPFKLIPPQHKDFTVQRLRHDANVAALLLHEARQATQSAKAASAEIEDSSKESFASAADSFIASSEASTVKESPNSPSLTLPSATSTPASRSTKPSTSAGGKTTAPPGRTSRLLEKFEAFTQTTKK